MEGGEVPEPEDRGALALRAPSTLTTVDSKATPAAAGSLPPSSQPWRPSRSSSSRSRSSSATAAAGCSRCRPCSSCSCSPALSAGSARAHGRSSSSSPSSTAPGRKAPVCLDGTPPGFHLQTGSGSGSHNWLIHLEGGGWCSTVKDCSNHRMSQLGSSNFMKPISFAGGIFSSDLLQNPVSTLFGHCMIRFLQLEQSLCMVLRWSVVFWGCGGRRPGWKQDFLQRVENL